MDDSHNTVNTIIIVNIVDAQYIILYNHNIYKIRLHLHD